MIRLKAWRCNICGIENMFAEPSIMIIMEERDYCKRCGKMRESEREYRVLK